MAMGYNYKLFYYPLKSTQLRKGGSQIWSQCSYINTRLDKIVSNAMKFSLNKNLSLMETDKYKPFLCKYPFALLVLQYAYT